MHLVSNEQTKLGKSTNLLEKNLGVASVCINRKPRRYSSWNQTALLCHGQHTFVLLSQKVIPSFSAIYAAHSPAAALVYRYRNLELLVVVLDCAPGGVSFYQGDYSKS